MNPFARWKTEPAAFPLLTGVSNIRFEARCSTGLGGTPPHLDVVAESPQAVVGVESKCLEYLTPTTPHFADSYDSLGHRWGGSLAGTSRSPTSGANRGHLDVAQLIKHYCGLRYCYRDQPTMLVYLFWEPENHAEVAECRAHREEFLRFAEAVSGDDVEFVGSSYPTLWASLTVQPTPPWLRQHSQNLRDRYYFVI